MPVKLKFAILKEYTLKYTYKIPPNTKLAVAIGMAEGYNFSQSSDFTFFTKDNHRMRKEPIPMFTATRIAPILNHNLKTRAYQNITSPGADCSNKRCCYFYLSYYLRNKSALALICCVIVHSLEVSCKEDQITSLQRE